MPTTETEKIAKLNDMARELMPMFGQLMLTSGISNLDPDVRGKILDKVRLFKDFSEDNDPYGEHDFGSIDTLGEKVFWKIDYYGLDMESGSENPADARVTKRVLTIMLAEEY
tara:strand:+ start:323 stop:658 length:336 start_codon:yes stop_codon:yes gene_type:complete